MLYLLFLSIINVGFAFVIAKAAKDKGYSPVGFWLLAFFTSFVVAIIVISILKNKQTETAPAEIESSPYKANFLGKYAVFIVLQVFLGFSALLISASMGGGNLSRMDGVSTGVIRYFVVFLLLALAAVISVKSDGIDLSTPSMMLYGATLFALFAEGTQSFVIAAIIALILCAFSGLVTGVLIHYVKMPAIVTTLIQGVALYGSSLYLCDGMTISLMLESRFFSREWFQLIIAVVAVGLVIALIAGTKLKISSNERSAEDKKDFIFAAAYSFSAVLAGTAGIIMALAMQASTPNLGSNYLIYILCIFAAISATRLAQSKLGVLSIAAGTAFILAVFTLALNIVGVTVYIQYSMLASFAFLLTLFMVLSRKNPISILGNE